MPKAGDIKSAKDLGFKGWAKYIWTPCPDCGVGRWIQANKARSGFQLHCKSCAMKRRGLRQRNSNAPSWKGGRHKTPHGYVKVMLDWNDSNRAMATKSGYILEHRLVMARHLKRPLLPTEIVHHKNGVKDDNRVENLELTTNGQHVLEHSKGYEAGFKKGLKDGRLKRIRDLQAEVESLRAEIERLKHEGTLH